nr:unnamed protein product [Spirometra erinaceieuropaei]
MKCEDANKATRFTAVIAAFFMMFTLGYMGSQGNLSPYIMSYLCKYVDPSIRNSHVVWLTAAGLTSNGLTMPLSGLLIHRLGFRVIVFASFILYSGGILLSYFTIKINFGVFLLTQYLMLGTGLGCCYSHLLSLAASWFPKQRGLVVGLFVCGFGSGAIVLTPLQTLLINPNNIHVNNDTQMFEDEELLHRVPRAFLIIGGILAGIQLIACMVMRPKPSDEKASIISSKSNGLQVETMKALDNQPAEKEISPPELFKMPEVYILWSIMFLTLLPLTLVLSAIKIIGQMKIDDDSYLSTVATLGAVVNTISRMAWGPVCDVLSFKVPLLINSLVYAVALTTFPFVMAVKTAGRYLYAIWAILLQYNIGGYFVLLPFAVSRAFGNKHFATNYGIVFTSFIPGGIIGAAVVAAITLEYHTRDIFIVCGATIFLVAILACALEDEKAPAWCRGRWMRRGKAMNAAPAAS